MSIEEPEELEGMQRVGAVVAEALREAAAFVRPRITTAQLDRVAADVFRRHGARSGPRITYGFPGTICVSVDDEAVHGIPGPRRLRDGQLVKIDVTAELDGYYADACVTVAVGEVAPDRLALIDAATAGLAAGMDVARAGTPMRRVGAAVDRAVRAGGATVCHELMGHGIGRALHEPPQVPSVDLAHLVEPLTAGLVMTIEPIIAMGRGDVVPRGDGWTIATADGSVSAHVEHTVVVRDGQPPLVLTA